MITVSIGAVAKCGKPKIERSITTIRQVTKRIQIEVQHLFKHNIFNSAPTGISFFFFLDHNSRILTEGNRETQSTLKKKYC